MRKRVAVVVDNAFGITCSAGCKIQHHRISRQSLHTPEFFGGSFHSSGQIFKSFYIILNAPEPGCPVGLFQGCNDLFGNLVLRSTHNGLYSGGFNAVDKITDCQHIGGGDHHGAQLVQSNSCKPVFIVPFQNQHDPVAAADPCIAEDIRHLIAVFFYIRK